MRAARVMPIRGIFFFLILSSLVPLHGAFADVAPGDVIDQSSWQKAQGLLPDSIMTWVKDGEYVLNVGELQYELKEYLPAETRESMAANVGKYDLNDKDLIVEKGSGKYPEFVQGVPFPVIDPDDPKAGAKIMHNREYAMLLSVGNVVYHPRCVWLGNGGYEREVGALYINAAMDGYSGARSLANPERIQRYCIIRVIQPFDVAGFAMMLWRYRDDRQDMNLAYLPAIRRVRRMSPANRSDAFVGSDFCIDDPYGYDGKVSAFAWKLLRKQDALFPFVTTEPEKVVRNPDGEWQTVMPRKGVVYGYEVEGWKGAAWAPTNLAWVKRPGYVLEAISRDPYYNYGKMEVWADAEVFSINYKMIYDRSGQYWKTFYGGCGGLESQDKTTRFMMVRLQLIVDDRSKHSSIIENTTDADFFYAKFNMDDFTLAGFQKYCK